LLPSGVLKHEEELTRTEARRDAGNSGQTECRYRSQVRQEIERGDL
jgi:hypothetical protein